MHALWIACALAAVAVLPVVTSQLQYSRISITLSWPAGGAIAPSNVTVGMDWAAEDDAAAASLSALNPVVCADVDHGRYSGLQHCTRFADWRGYAIPQLPPGDHVVTVCVAGNADAVNCTFIEPVTTLVGFGPYREPRDAAVLDGMPDGYAVKEVRDEQRRRRREGMDTGGVWLWDLFGRLG